MANNPLEELWKSITSMDAKRVGTMIGTATADPSALIQEISIESEYTPQIRLRRPAQTGTGKGESLFDPILKTLKPKITVTFPDGTMAPLVMEPWGSPQGSKWPIIAGATALGTLFVGYFVFKGLTCKCGR